MKQTKTQTNQTTTPPQVEEELFNYTDNEVKTYYVLALGEGDNLKSLCLYPTGKVIDIL